jgi:hypothetical protein
LGTIRLSLIAPNKNTPYRDYLGLPSLSDSLRHIADHLCHFAHSNRFWLQQLLGFALSILNGTDMAYVC